VSLANGPSGDRHLAPLTDSHRCRSRSTIQCLGCENLNTVTGSAYLVELLKAFHIGLLLLGGQIIPLDTFACQHYEYFISPLLVCTGDDRRHTNMTRTTFAIRQLGEDFDPQKNIADRTHNTAIVWCLAFRSASGPREEQSSFGLFPCSGRAFLSRSEHADI
jgi:hypothetical protein